MTSELQSKRGRTRLVAMEAGAKFLHGNKQRSPQAGSQARPFEGPIAARTESLSVRQCEVESGQQLENSHTNQMDSTREIQIRDATNRQQQHHVGPVMGIFFKVWSLVKVTKVRNQGKMRRQNSEDASQFHYISGDQLEPSAPQHQHHHQHQGAALLQDRQFRRAGSQPAPSCSRALEPMRLVSSADNRLRVTSAITGANTSTTSTSSGVSSTNSSTLAADSPSSAVRRHVSASNLRRATADAPALPSTDQTASTEIPNSGPNNWASKIKRSATTVNQSDMSSRYRFKRDQSVAASRPLNSNYYSQARSLLGVNLQELENREEHCEEASDDNDSNEIYSTPNDSIQSVPSTAPVICNEKLAQGSAARQIKSQAFPIMKSFSTNNFSQSTQQQFSDTRLKSFKPIDELGGETLLHQSRDSESRKLNGSRFFISSSSSEDSNSPHQHQNKLEKGNKLLQQQPSLALEQSNQQFPLELGVHCHLPASLSMQQRPDSLFADSPAAANWNQVSLFSPSSAQTPVLQTPPSGGGSFGPTSPLDLSAPLAKGCPGQASSSSYFKKSPSSYEFQDGPKSSSRLGGKSHPLAGLQHQPTQVNQCFNFKPPSKALPAIQQNSRSNGPECPLAPSRPRLTRMVNSVSLYDCKPNNNYQFQNNQLDRISCQNRSHEQTNSEYKLAQMLLESGSNPANRDEEGNTALMHAVLSDNISAIKCLVERGVDLQATNHAGHGALDLACSGAATSARIEILKLLIEQGANVDQARESDGTRLLDRLIEQHTRDLDKLPFIEVLLQNGAKLGSSTWLAASSKPDIQLRLLRKLCQDGYYLYKESSLEGAIYRFEYALKRICELEQQVACNCRNGNLTPLTRLTLVAARQIKYQTYLGLSRCERKRKFYRRALEFAHMSILVESTSYEGYYSKAHILKDLGEIDDSLIAIDQTSRLVDKSIETVKCKLNNLQLQEDSLIFDGCFNMVDPSKSDWLETTRIELSNTLDYLREAKKFVSRLRGEIMDDKLNSSTCKQLFSSAQIAT